MGRKGDAPAAGDHHLSHSATQACEISRRALEIPGAKAWDLDSVHCRLHKRPVR